MSEAVTSEPEELRSWRDPDRDVLVRITDWLVQEPVTQQYFEREASAAVVWNYLRRYGPTTVIRKIRSRLAERGRNEKVAGVAAGVVLEGPEGCGLRPGERVLVLAPNASSHAIELVVDRRLVVPGYLRVITQEIEAALSQIVAELKGFSRFSGASLPSSALEALATLPLDVLEPVGSATPSNTTDRVRRNHQEHTRPTAVIFGLGNYAKTLIIPNIKRRLDLTCVHDVDPDQLSFLRGSGVALDTSPVARDDERYDAWFIAGYHHTHTDLAITALQRGGYAVVEKPLVTTPDQFAALQAALEGPAAGRLIACFQKRYAAFNRHIHPDLGVQPGEAVHMSALVYEVPLPRLHWYNWPNSGSRIISNACHWLDFFMWVNRYSSVARCSARYAGQDDVHCLVDLENGASLLLELTHKGSPRVGVREMIELRSDDATVRIVDAASYSAENGAGVIRRLRVNPVSAYATMYRRIAAVVADKVPGDCLQTMISTELMLELERSLDNARLLSDSAVSRGGGNAQVVLAKDSRPEKNDKSGNGKPSAILPRA